MASWWFDSLILRPYPPFEFLSPARLSQIPPIYHIIKYFCFQNKSKNKASTQFWHTTTATNLDNFSSTFWQLFKSWHKLWNPAFDSMWHICEKQFITNKHTLFTADIEWTTALRWSQAVHKNNFVVDIAASKVFLTIIILKNNLTKYKIIKGVSPTWAKTNGW